MTDPAQIDLHTFGSALQASMDDDERHASGAHYTAREDIMRVVGPTILDPWRRRIEAASTLDQLQALRRELASFTVLDPACGSGNFLYVTFQELRRLETEMLTRMRGASVGAHSSIVSITNFFGLDTNELAVKLARTTLNLAKRASDPSAPPDNLDDTIRCADALFTDWPEVDAIVGNPPFLGGLKIRSELGPDYLASMRERFSEVNGRADLCAYWFRLAHDNLRPGGRAGLIATNTVREGHTRAAALDYIVDRGGTIVDAVSSLDWPGEATVKVAVVNWVKGAASPPFRLEVDRRTYSRAAIAPHLQLHPDLSAATSLAANAQGTTQGVVLGTKRFRCSRETARRLARDERAKPYLKVIATATDLLRGRLETAPNFVIDLTTCDDACSAKSAGSAFDYLEANVLPLVREKARTATTNHYRRWLDTWWRPFWPREEFFSRRPERTRMIACSRHAARPIFVFLSPRFLATESLQLFDYEDDYSFGVLQSRLHWDWATAKGSKIKADTRYTKHVWSTFPWPQAPSERDVVSVMAAARELWSVRRRLMTQNSWSLRELHRAADTAGAHALAEAQSNLDQAVRSAYDIPRRLGAVDFLLDLNLRVSEDESRGYTVQGPGFPASSIRGMTDE